MLKKIKEEEIKSLFKDKEDKLGCYLEIHSGSGGLDAQDFAGMLCRAYTRWSERHSFETQLVEETKGESNTLKSTTLCIEGLFAYGLLKAEIGVHRLVRMSPFNSDGKRHTSFVAIHAYPILPEENQFIIEDKDLKIDTFRASGAGGQHVNTTDSAVRITHIPTGVVVQCQGERSQHKNKETALSLLKSKLFSLQEQQKSEDKKKLHKNKQSIDFGSQIRSYVLHPYTLVKDHRTNLENYNIKSVLDGELDDFMLEYLSTI